MADRVILHCDCNSFFASVEELLHPELKKVPMAVAGDPENRHGIILAKNERAKRYDIQTAETIWQAKRKCPDLVLVPPHRDRYLDLYHKINEIYLSYTDLVEPFSIDESFLDVTGSLHLFGLSPRELADSIRARVREELGITISVGVSFCKTFAKLGSDYKKPDATTVIFREDVPKIVYPLPVSALLFVGEHAAAELGKYSIRTCGELAACDRAALTTILGKQGDHLYRVLHGMDHEPVASFYEKREAKSVGNSMTFSHDLMGEEEIHAGISALSDSVASRLRTSGKKCCGVQVGIKDPSFRTIQRQTVLPRPTYRKREIESVAMDLIRANWNWEKPVRLLSVTGYDLVDADEEGPAQLSLFDPVPERDEQQEKLEDTVASIRARFGKDSIALGVPKKPLSKD